MLIFKKLMNNYIVKGKIIIIKCEHKKKLIYIYI